MNYTLMKTLPELLGEGFSWIGDKINSLICDLLSGIWNWIVGMSYWVCLIAGLFFFFAYVLTKEQKAKYKLCICLLGYLFIMAVNSLL